MGLLDAFDTDQGRFALGLLAAAGPRADGAGFGQRLQEAVTGVQTARDADMRRKLAALQLQASQQTLDKGRLDLEEAQRLAADQKFAADLARQYFSPGAPARGAVGAIDSALPADLQTGVNLPAVPATPPRFDMQGFAAARFAQNPQAGMALLQALQKDLPVNKINPESYTPDSLARFSQSRNYADLVPRDKLEFVEGVGVNPFDPRNANRAIPNPNKPFSMGADGQPVPNTPFQTYEINKAKAGAANTSVKVENKMGESLAGQVGPMVKDTFTAANGAIQTAQAANQILQAVNRGNLYAGPFANARMTAAQLGDALGVTGKDTTEKIANTRQTIQGLAQMTLQGRKQMTGQGAITESESRLAERAMSGDITMTGPEIAQLANAARRSAEFTYGQHRMQLGNMQQDPNLQGLARFYQVAPFPEAPQSAPNVRVPTGAKFLGFE